ncbi:MAG: ERAP1-like C-terminal domain-containing protein [Acidimicrobiales bacterium]
MATYLDLARTFADETDLSVWQRLVGSFRTLDHIVPDAARTHLQGFVRSLVGPVHHHLGNHVDDEADRTSSLRSLLFEALGQLGADESIRGRARDLHEQGAAEPGSVNPDLFDGAVRVIASSGDEATFDDFIQRSKEAKTPQDKLRYLGALADSPSASVIQRLLALTLTDEIRTQDAPFVLRRSIINRDQGPAAWGFVHRHWDEINDRFPSNSIPRLLDGIRVITDPAVAADVEAFLAEHPVPQGARIVAQHLERMQVSVSLRKREAEALADALR